MAEWVSQSEAARRETSAGRPVAQSSISRFLAGNADIPTQRGPSGTVLLVEYTALAAARAASLHVQDKLALRGDVQPSTPPRPGLTDQQRLQAAKREKEELDLAERKGELLSRRAVTLAVEAAGAAFVQALERRRRAVAQKIAGLTDPRAVEHELKAADRSMQEALVNDLARATLPPSD